MGNQFEVSGKYNTAKIFTDNIEPEAVAQIISLCNQRAFEGSKIRIMPDVHAGKGCTIGTTMTIVDKVIPNLVGVDIGCGMHVADLSICEGDIDLAEVDDIIRQYVPAGFSVRGKAHRFARNVDIEGMCCHGKIKGSENRILLSVGTLGGGNHFIEIDKDENGRLFLVVHTGSRNLGVAVATYYQNEAWRRLSAKFGKEARDEIITRLKEEGRQSEISAELKALTATCGVQKEFAYCEGSLFSEYMHDMKIVQEYASWNRRAIVDEILGHLDITAVNVFETIHNYIDIENRILRKGSVSAQKGEKLIIPMNMRDGSLICIGKGNPDWNFSAPHGAGRLMSRSRAKDEISLEDFKESMKGIYTSSVGFGTIDESPMAYKPMESIVSNIGDTVDIIGIIKPVYNFKAGEEGGEIMDTKKYFNNMRVLLDDYRHNIAEWEKAADKYCEEHGELAAEEWAKENMMPNSPFSPGALNAMRLWEYKEKHGEDEISDAVIIYTSEIREFVSALREAGVESFLLTRSNSMLIERIHEYAKYGCSVDGPAIAVRYHGQTRIEERALRIRIN